MLDKVVFLAFGREGGKSGQKQPLYWGILFFCFCKKIANPTFNAHAGWGGSGWAKLMTWSAKSKINVTFWCCLRMFSNPRPCLQFNTSSPITQYSGSNVSRGKFLSLRKCSNYLIWRIAQSFFLQLTNVIILVDVCRILTELIGWSF